MYIVSDSVGKDKLNSRWEDGVFVGIRERSGEILIGTHKGVVKARAFRRKGTEKERWNNDEIEKCTGLPWEPVPGREGIEVKSSVNERRDPDEEIHCQRPRSARLYGR